MSRTRITAALSTALLLALPLVVPGQETRELVEGPTPVRAGELEEVLAQVEQALAPFELAEIAGPPPDAGGTVVMIGGVVTPTRSASRDDGTVVTVMSAHKGPGMPPENAGVWHGAGRDSGFLGALRGNMGKLVLRLFGPSSEEAAQPFGFTRISLFDAGSETEYTLEENGWVVRRYVGAEQ